MKKYVSIALTIMIFFIIVIVMRTIYVDNANLTEPEKNAEISKIIFQSVLAGSITFLGLFVTIVTQDLQNEAKEKKQICPCFILTANGKASAEIDSNESPAGLNQIIRCNYATA